jgi:ubiquitin-like protein Pup
MKWSGGGGHQLAERVQKTKPKTKKKPAETVAAEEKVSKTAEHDKRIAELDEVLDNIDGVLEENAEEFVKSYIQKGGQ